MTGFHEKIIWSPAALDDLQAGFYFISNVSPRRAHEWLSRLLGQVERLAGFPGIGHRVQELDKGSRYRQMIVGDYRVFHEVRDKEIFILRILHSRQIFED